MAKTTEPTRANLQKNENRKPIMLHVPYLYLYESTIFVATSLNSIFHRVTHPSGSSKIVIAFMIDDSFPP